MYAEFQDIGNNVIAVFPVIEEGADKFVQVDGVLVRAEDFVFGFTGQHIHVAAKFAGYQRTQQSIDEARQTARAERLGIVQEED
jgi:hypothetical protein